MQLSERAIRKYAKLIGKQFGDYVVLEVWNDPGSGHQSWRMKCVNCGKEVVVKDSSPYRNGRTKGICKCRRVKS